LFSSVFVSHYYKLLRKKYRSKENIENFYFINFLCHFHALKANIMFAKNEEKKKKEEKVVKTGLSKSKFLPHVVVDQNL
jgi:hypothetical protein